MAAVAPLDVQARLRELIAHEHEGGWDSAWQQKLTPWDAGEPQPPLRDLLTSGEIDLPKSGKALVPGCGRGYDAVLIASHLGLETTGLDISSTALAAAQEYAESSSVPPGTSIHFAVEDFFTLAPSPEDRYDLIYDYTFFVAISPAQRPEWGRQMSALLKPGGYLITLVYPIANQPEGFGPPFFVRPENYVDVLGEGWEKVLDKVPDVSLEHHKGAEQLIVYRKL